MVGPLPRFAEPKLTRNGAQVVTELGVHVPKQPPLPDLIEPESLGVVDRSQHEPLVLVEHPRISVLGNYRLAGWSHAMEPTWLRSSAMDRLAQAADSLPDRWGMCVFDAWRPLDLQAELYDAAYADPDLPPGFVSPADPDPRTPPPHLTGGTVDASLTLDGIALGLGADFDDFTARARADAIEAEPGVDRELRRLLYWTMRRVGFVVLDCEWWHFEYGTRRWATITGRCPLFGPASPPLGSSRPGLSTDQGA